jgi:hypothetical protein
VECTGNLVRSVMDLPLRPFFVRALLLSSFCGPSPSLPDHAYPVRFRNIWIRGLGHYDQD